MNDSTDQFENLKLSESEYLRAKSDHAKAQVVDSLNRAKAALTHNVDPRELTRRHPWIAIASAAAAGFTAAVVAIPSKEEQELRRLERLHRAMNPPQPAPAAPAAESNGHPKKPVEAHSFFATILHEVIQIIRPILLASITSSLKSGMNPPPPAAPAAEPPPGP